MGIRFLCPNGHRLNVKAFLAGKRGVCPHCGAKMMIPLESQLAPRSKTKKTGGEASLESGGGTATATRPKVTPADPAKQAQRAVVRPKVKSDPIAESPDMVWYVRPKAGGQYGPARGEVMSRWIEQGRVAADSLVWREGWDDWEVASDVLPQLSSAESDGEDQSPPPEPKRPAAKAKKVTARPVAAKPKTKPQPAPADVPEEDSKPAPPATGTLRKRRRKTNPKALTAVIVLSLVSIGLLVALVLVLMQRGSA